MNNFEVEINNIKRELLSFDHDSQFTQSNQSHTKLLELMDKDRCNDAEQLVLKSDDSSDALNELIKQNEIKNSNSNIFDITDISLEFEATQESDSEYNQAKYSEILDQYELHLNSLKDNNSLSDE